MKKTLPILALTSTLMSIGGFNLFSCAKNGNNQDIELTPVTKEKKQMNPNVPNITIKDFRLQILDDSTIRLEHKYDNPIFHTYDWLDDDTLFVSNRTSYEGVKDYQVKTEFNNTIVTFSDIKIVIPNDVNESLDGIKAYRITENGEELIFNTTGLNSNNTGNLPNPEATPQAFPLVDYPRIIEPPFGYSASNLYVEPYRSHLSYFSKTCGFEIQNHKDIYLMFPRGNAKALRQQYRNLAGPSELVRLSTLGAWDSRYYPYNETTAQEEVDHYHENNLPLDNLVIDTDWRAGFDGKGYFVNETLFPNMPRFLRSIHDQNIEVCFNDHPEPQKDEYTGRELDVLNQQEVEFRRTNLKKILDMGLDTWWYDRNWSTSLICPTGTDEDMLNHETWGDYLYNNVTRQTHMAQASKEYEELGQYVYKRPIAMSNVVQIHNGEWREDEGFTDSAAHRYSIQWTGDQNSKMLDTEILNVIKTGINSMPYMSSDLAGHTNPVASDYYYQRWMEYGALSPIFRIHCTRDLPIHCQPWLRGEEITNVFRNWINLRYRLLPLYYSLAREAYETGLPICRALGFNYPNIQSDYAKYMEQEYMIGNNILFAPCVENDVVTSEDFQGTWADGVHADFFTNKNLEGEVAASTTYPKLDIDDMSAEGKKFIGLEDNFSVRFEGTFTPSITKELVLNADDGVRVAVTMPDGTIKTASDWSAHSPQDLRTKIVLEANQSYPMTVEYFEDTQGAEIHMRSCDPDYHKEYEEKSLYLPEGEWYDLFHGKKYNGPVEIKDLPFTTAENAVFVRLGSMTPIVNNAANTKELDWTKLTYDVYPSTTASDVGTLYEDDFETVAYQLGYYHKSNYQCYYDNKTNEFVIHLDPSQGTYVGDDIIANREYNIRIHEIPGMNLSGVTLDGKAITPVRISKATDPMMPFGFGEQQTSTNDLILVKIPSGSIRVGHEIRIQIK
ncbi:MAG: DUF5110 domain-containing protein [Mycoplasma sp.]|nr:DUF5110 domain-containing protein [Candidatus Hennigella equi]